MLSYFEKIGKVSQTFQLINQYDDQELRAALLSASHDSAKCRPAKTVATPAPAVSGLTENHRHITIK
jgi:hypothetical protein